MLCGLNGATLSANAALSDKDKEKDDKKDDKKDKDRSRSHSTRDGTPTPTHPSHPSHPAASLPSLVTTAPEVVLGAAASAEASVWAAGAVCVHIVTGKPLIKVRG